jgi:predicted GIY-YIG superfamily endonuclease
MARHERPHPPNEPAIYLLHLERPIAGHASHYLGEAKSLARRLREHSRGEGARFLAHAYSLGIGWELVRWWSASDNDKERIALERRLKQHHGKRLCPRCNPQALNLAQPERWRVQEVKWPRPRRFGRYLDASASAVPDDYL